MKPAASTVRRALVVTLAAAALLTAASALATRRAGPTGLQLSVSGPSGSSTRLVTAVDVRDVRDATRHAGFPARADWRAAWRVGRPGRHRVVVESDAPVKLVVDEVVLLDTGGGRARAEVGLAEGMHDLVVVASPRRTPGRLTLHVVDPAGRRQTWGGTAVFPAAPSPAQVTAAGVAAVLRPAALVAWLVGLVLLAGHVARLAPGEPLRRVVRIAVPALVVLYGGALRFEALVGRYWHDAPPAVLALERAVTPWRPAELLWEPSPTHDSGDPFHYYQRARQMDSFYGPHVREPLFPWTARQLGRWLGDRPLVVDAASAVYSTLAVFATFLLGAVAFGWTAGVGAALLLAVDADVIWWGVEGFRDDAFMAFTLLTTAALLRLRERPCARWTVLTGLAAGAACLSRLSALSFLLPALVWSALPRDAQAPARRRALALALALALFVCGPYMVSCALAWGDPFYAVNHHTRFYRARSGASFDSDMSATAWLRGSFAPGALVATGVEGLTTFPFRSKWRGLDPAVSVPLRRLLTWMSAAGLVLMALFPRGRLVLVVLLGALLPYAFTWNIPGGAEWRFTMVAYPFYLLAALAAVPLAREAVTAMRSGSVRRPWRGTEPGPPPG